MTNYLKLDGVDDYVKLPTLTFSTIELDVNISSLNNDQSTTRYLFDARNGHTNFFVYNGTYSNGKPAQVSLNNGTYYTWSEIPKDERIILVASGVSGTDDINIGSHNNSSSGYSILDLYKIVLYDTSNNIIAHYDMSTGTVQDQSGDGNHATLYGGMWENNDNSGSVGTIVDSDIIILTSTTDLLSSASRNISGLSNINGQSILTSHPTRLTYADSSFIIYSEVNSNAYRIIDNHASLNTVGQLLSTITKINNGQSDLLSYSSFSANGVRILSTTSKLESLVDMNATADKISLEISANLSPTTNLNSDGIKVMQSKSNLSDTTNLLANGEVITLDIFANLNVSSLVDVNGTRIISGNSNIYVDNEIISTGTVIYNGESIFIADTDLIALSPDYIEYKQIIHIPLTIQTRQYMDMQISRKIKQDIDITTKKSITLRI